MFLSNLKLDLGNKGEDWAAKFLKEKGYKILDRNLTTPFGEVDIIARDGNTIVFIEVKTRSSDIFGQPFEAVNYRKQERLKKIALFYLKGIKKDLPIRFDVVSIIYRNGKAEISHIINAF
jgi:putative endonuclease